ncbi:MAG: hypothetical protein KF849_09725 [Rhizobiaceae bacterium]|nr:hypothetical protein [Rhizobiaceae bacterium]
MSIFDGLMRFAENRIEARAARRTRMLLAALPESIQKDIGWNWTPRHRGQHRNGDIGFLGQ